MGEVEVKEVGQLVESTSFNGSDSTHLEVEVFQNW